MLRVLFTLAIVIVIANAKMARATARRSGIRPLLIIIIVIDYFIQISSLMAKKSPGLYCQQLGGSIFALSSSLPYQEKRSPVRLTNPKWVVCGLERST
jgi:hypothetical protein